MTLDLFEQPRGGETNVDWNIGKIQPFTGHEGP